MFEFTSQATKFSLPTTTTNLVVLVYAVALTYACIVSGGRTSPEYKSM